MLLVAACAASSPPPVSYPLHPRLRSASGGPIAMLGAVERPGAVPYTPGITLTAALRLSGGPTALAHRWADVTRGDTAFRVPLAAVLAHEAPDPELAPGDIVVVESLRVVD